MYYFCSTGTAEAVTVGAGIFSVVVAVAVTFEIEVTVVMAVDILKGGIVARLILLDVSAGVGSAVMVVEPVISGIPGPVDVPKADTSVGA
jgi:hypothetical protein